MNNKTTKEQLFRVLAITFFITYGIHYFGYFIRVRYYNLIAPIADVNPGWYSIIRYLGHIIFTLCFVIYVLAVKEDRKYFKELKIKKENHDITKFFIGILIGFILNGSCVFAAALHGDIVISNSESINIGLFVFAFCALFIQASQEEFESRVFFFGKLEDGGFPVEVAIILSAVFFSYLHSNNPGFGLVPFLSITICGVCYVLLYRYTGSIWAASGVHIMWNFTQDYIFGLPNSGNPSGMSIFASKAINNSFFYDTVFGVEGSIFSILVNAVAVVILIILIKNSPKLQEKK